MLVFLLLVSLKITTDYFISSLVNCLLYIICQEIAQIHPNVFKSLALFEHPKLKIENIQDDCQILLIY